MRRKYIICMIIMLTLFSSCDKKAQDMNTADYFLMEYQSINEIKNSIKGNTPIKINNLTIDSVRIGNGENMPNYDFKFGGVGLSNNYKNENLIKLSNYMFNLTPNSINTKFIDKNEPIIEGLPYSEKPIDLNNDGMIERPNSYMVDILSFVPDEEHISKGIYVHSTGSSFGSSTGFDDIDVYWRKNYPIVEMYDTFNSDISSSVRYTMNDGNEWGVGEAKVYFEDFFNEYLSSFDNTPLTYCVDKIYVKQLTEKNYAYLAKVITIDQDGNLFDYDSSTIGLTEESALRIASGEPFIYPEKALIYSWEKEKIGEYIKSNSLKDLTKTSENNELLSFRSAVNILSENIGKNQAIEIPFAELCYVKICKGYPYYKEWEWDYASQGDVFYDTLCKENCNFELRPMWTFQTSYDIENITYSEKYYVDATNGTFYKNQ